MASPAPVQMLQVTVNFDQNRTVLHLPKNMKVGLAIQKAAEQFKVSPQGLTFLYHGNDIPDDMTVADALGRAHNVTVIHMIRVTSKKKCTAPVYPSLDGKKREILFGFCKECEGLAESREIFLCPGCRFDSVFQRASAEPINHFARSVNPAFLRGACPKCMKEDLQAQVQFVCTNCTKGSKIETVGILRQIRDNRDRNIKCMKCGLKREEIFRFACGSRHCICLECFSNWCKQQMNAGKFKNFEGMGFSIGCPGPGEDCAHIPVPDPHHFKVVDDDFYENFKEMSIREFQPPGENIFCNKCKVIVDTGTSTEAEVTEPEGAVVVSGLRWYHKLLGMKPDPPPPRKRRRTSCSQCQLQYCVHCKQVWHEGDCRKMDSALAEEEQAFPIDPALARESCWPEED